MTEFQQKYMKQHRAWMKAREGGLTLEQESEWVDGQERLWWQMSAAEQDELEKMVAFDNPIKIPTAPKNLNMVDVVAASGVMPRKPVVVSVDD